MAESNAGLDVHEPPKVPHTLCRGSTTIQQRSSTCTGRFYLSLDPHHLNTCNRFGRLALTDGRGSGDRSEQAQGEDQLHGAGWNDHEQTQKRSQLVPFPALLSPPFRHSPLLLRSVRPPSQEPDLEMVHVSLPRYCFTAMLRKPLTRLLS